MTSLAPDIHFLHKEKPLSPWILAMIAFGVCVPFIGGLFLNVPVIVFAILPIAISLGLHLARSGKAALYGMIGAALALSFRLVSIRGTDPFDLLMGAIIGGITLSWGLRHLVIERDSVTFSVPQLLAALFLMWGLFTGLGGILWWNNTFNDWAREFLIQCPLLILPLLYARHFEADTQSERQLHRVLFFAAIMMMCASVFKYVVILSRSAYAYQIGRLSDEPSAAMLMIFLSVAFALYQVKWVPMFVQIGLGVFSFAILLLSGYRTLWAAAAVGVITLIFLARPEYRRNAIRYLIYLTGALLSIGTYLFLTVKLFRVYVLMTWERILSTTQLATDPSLVNRYIESDALKSAIANSPLVGYGYGSQFQTFDWLLGYSYNTGFSHNGFYFVAFKTGLIGFSLIFTAYIWFMVKAFKITRDLSESFRTRAIASVVFCYLACQLIANSTLNIFGERKVMIWVGLCWGFLLSKEVKERFDAKKQQAKRSEDAATQVSPTEA
jgi:hypothetical protein